MIEYQNYITRAMLRAEPEKLFVFGDNFQHRGFGGQAKEMRGEPNAVGIPTKTEPTMKPQAFLSNDMSEVWGVFCGKEIAKLLTFSGTIVWPSAGIGTGLAQLPSKAPKIWQAIERLRLGLEYRVSGKTAWIEVKESE